MTYSENHLREIAAQAGLHLQTHESIHGGDINQAYKLNCREGRFFLKLNHASKYPLMFEKEARGLDALRKSGILIVPCVISTGVLNDKQYLLLECLEPGKPGQNFWENFGRGLASIHKNFQHSFGWDEDNYIGSLVQKNDRKKDWPSFYAQCRIMPLINRLKKAAVYTSDDVLAAEKFCEKINNLFPEEHASLLHGDLWSGNFMSTQSGEAAIYDPAVYCGHREIDLGMTLLFGGFEKRFYDAYHELYPLQNDWKERVRITQLYPLLVHALLFGGHYIEGSRQFIQSY